MLLLEGHHVGRAVRSLAFAPDGSLASCGGDNTVRLWDAAGRGRILGVYRAPCWLAVAPDGDELAVCHQGGVSLRPLAGGQGRDVGWGARAVFSPDGRLLATALPGLSLWQREDARLLASEDPLVLGLFRRFWSWLTGQAAPVSRPSAGVVTGLAFAPDGRTLATARPEPGATGYCVRLEDPATGAELGRLRGPGGQPRALAFRPDGRVLAAACGQFLWAWELSTGRELARLKVGTRHFQALAFTPDGRFLAATHNDAVVRFWDATTWTEAGAFAWQIGPLLSLAFAPDGMRAAAGGGRGRIVVWDVDL
jgi:WD40 repeat protein